MSSALQDKKANNLRAQKTEMIESGHLPMLSQPDQLAKIIHSFIKDMQ